MNLSCDQLKNASGLVSVMYLIHAVDFLTDLFVSSTVIESRVWSSMG